MKIQVLCVGKIKDSFNQNMIDMYCSTIRKGGNEISIVEYPDVKIPEQLNETQKERFLEEECDKMIQQLTHTDYVIALCVEGKELTTTEHAMHVKQACDSEYHTVTYIIGGSLGLPKKIKTRANLKLSFSKMTFPHQLMRCVLCEEIANVFSNV